MMFREPSACRKRLSRILEHAGCKHVRFHDLRHTFATMALENGIDIKTLAEILGHNTVSTALNTYTHSTAKMQEFASRLIDRVIGRVDDDAEQNINATTEVSSATEPVFEPYKGKKRKPGTGYVKQLSVNCWQGRYTPRVDGKRVSYNVYGKTEAECETKLRKLYVRKETDEGAIKMSIARSLSLIKKTDTPDILTRVYKETILDISWKDRCFDLWLD